MQNENDNQNQLQNDFIIAFAKKYKGQKVSDIPKKELTQYVEWMLAQPNIKAGSPLAEELQKIKTVLSGGKVEPAKAPALQAQQSFQQSSPAKEKPKPSGRVFKTKKGTELPIMDIHGKDYLEVKYRIQWFREETSLLSIRTEFIELTENSAFAKCSISDGGVVRATGHKYEDRKGFPDFREKAETGSIGRALALLGYGTQSCGDELDEGDRIVDAPADKPVLKNHAEVFPRPPGAKPVPAAEDPGPFDDGDPGPDIDDALRSGGPFSDDGVPMFGDYEVKPKTQLEVMREIAVAKGITAAMPGIIKKVVGREASSDELSVDEQFSVIQFINTFEKKRS